MVIFEFYALKAMGISSIFMLFFIFPTFIFSIELTNFTKLQLPPYVGSNTFAFDVHGEGPYTSVTDGRIFKYIDNSSTGFSNTTTSNNTSFIEFVYTSTNRSRTLCDGKNNTELISVCGQPRGFAFNYISGAMYYVDISYGLIKVESVDQIGRVLLGTHNGIPYHFLDGLDIDPVNGYVYFTDRSAVYGPAEIAESIQTGDSTARLMKYNPTTGEVSAILKNLAGATGVACSKDGKFVLVAEYIGKRIQKYWLQGKKAGKAETIIRFTGYPVKVKRNNEGNFWVALNSQNEDGSLPQGIKIDCDGKVLDSVDLRREYNDQYITTVQEHNYKLYIASPFENYVGVYNIES